MAIQKAQPREMSGGKATIYWVGALGALGHEVAEWRVRVAGAKHNGNPIGDRPVVEYRAPKKRKWEKAPVERRPTLLILDGWGHGGPKLFEESTTAGGFVSQSSLYATFDDRWESDFNDWADQYIALYASADHSSARVLADYRGFGVS